MNKKLLTFVFAVSLISIAFSLDSIKKSRAQALNIEEANARKLEEINFVTKIVGNCIRWREEVKERNASGGRRGSFRSEFWAEWDLKMRVRTCDDHLSDIIGRPRIYMSGNWWHLYLD